MFSYLILIYFFEIYQYKYMQGYVFLQAYIILCSFIKFNVNYIQIKYMWLYGLYMYIFFLQKYMCYSYEL